MMHARSGEDAPKDALWVCSSCGEGIHLAQGTPFPECPNEMTNVSWEEATVSQEEVVPAGAANTASRWEEDGGRAP